MYPEQLAAIAMERLEFLGNISEESGKLTRTYGSGAMERANETMGEWMRQAGMGVTQDAVGNLIGRYAGTGPKTLMLGSHLDTVRDAGKYDGALGVVVALACVQALHARGIKMPFAIEVVGFADEEGARFQSTYLGSRAMAGTFDPADLDRNDAEGVTMRQAIRIFGGKPEELHTARREPGSMLGYVEVHIEQGPVLENLGQPAGLVTAISGQTRMLFTYVGKAGHAGTTPLRMRRDALCGAARFILQVEEYAQQNPPLVATVGQIRVEPGASNVIPGKAFFTLDVRHEKDSIREVACESLAEMAREIGRVRELQSEIEYVQKAPTVACCPHLSSLLAEAVSRHQDKVIQMPSGAGHDAAAMSVMMPVGMLFVRCREGISHHAEESVQTKDVQSAIAVMLDFLRLLAKEQGHV